jgi:HAD superfamily hydrolase (TIGR01509 family)
MTDARRTLIFDVDGTLVDSTYLHAIAWHRAFLACALDVPMWRVHRSIGMGGDRLVAALCGDVVEDRMGDVLRDRWSDAYDELRKEVKPLPGAQTLLEKLRKEGHRVCVASSGSREDTEDALDVVGVHGLLDAVTTGDDVGSSKPAPDVLGVCWERVGRGPATVVGDTVYDVAAAQALGLPCITVRTGGFGEDELTQAGALLVVDDLTALIEDDWALLTA